MGKNRIQDLEDAFNETNGNGATNWRVILQNEATGITQEMRVMNNTYLSAHSQGANQVSKLNYEARHTEGGFPNWYVKLVEKL